MWIFRRSSHFNYICPRLVGILDMSMQMRGQLPPGMRPRGSIKESKTAEFKILNYAVKIVCLSVY